MLHIVTSLNGKISVESEVEKGSTFTVELPMRIMSEDVNEELLDFKAPEVRTEKRFEIQNSYISLLSNMEQPVSSTVASMSVKGSPVIIAEGK